MADDRDESGKRTCANAPCSCPVGDDDKYCSVHCQSTANHTQIDCDCGHPGCSGDF